MVLNYIWIALILISFLVGIIKVIFFGDFACIGEIVNSTFGSAKTGFEVSLGLTGVLCLWMGIMKIGERGGMVQWLSRVVSPLFTRIFPGIPKNHPASGAITLNVAANMLGLDNAATPAGLQAMQHLQELNADKTKASDAMIMFMVMNASGLTLIPVSVLTIRAQMGSANPADVFLPILIATFFSTMAAVFAVCLKQRVKIFDPVILGFFGCVTALIAGLAFLFGSVDRQTAQLASNFAAALILMTVIAVFIIVALLKKVNVYNSFIDGAKGGFAVAVRIIPYLVAILIAVGMFRASGAMNILTDGLKDFTAFLGFDTQWVDAFPTALMKPLSGSGARGMMVETISSFGADSFAGRLSGIFQASTDTTFYVAAVYLGSVGIKNGRYTVPYALFADLVGVIVAIFTAYLFFG